MKRTLLFYTIIFIAFVPGAQEQGKGGASSPGRSISSADITEVLSAVDRAFENPDESLSPEDEYYLGRAAAAQILQAYKLYTGNPALVSYVNKICQVIAINSPMPALFNGCHVGILDSPEINAFATPGGHIFLTRGIAACADSEDALAAVIAHEMAHIQLRHAAAIIEDQRLTNDLSQTADRAAAMALRNRSLQERAALFDGGIRAMTAALFRNGFAREQEFEADAAAAGLLRNAGYDPSALAAMLRILQKIQPLHPGGFNSTHPSPAARLANLAKVPLNGGGRAGRTARDSRFSAIREAAP
jgi:predicted Zn-dependent protease